VIIMKHGALVIALFLTGFCLQIRAAERRALLVGIDRYLPYPDEHANPTPVPPSERTKLRMRAVQGSPSRRSIPALSGAVNDAVAMKEILIDRFGFDERNIVLLTNEEATADRILALLQTQLIDRARPGDVSLFYFAGHGSRIRNIAAQNRNASGFDSTLVPADSLLGVPDIRSKELARIYAQAPRKGITLTVIHDSCFSGAASRGPISARKIRAQPADGGLSINDTLEVPLPEDEGVLVLSASQDYEPAAELSSTDLGGAHGVFTWALLHSLAASPVNSSIGRIFQRSRALMQSKAPDQEPVLLAKNGRNDLGLFGQPADSGRGVTVAAGRVAGDVIKLNAGLAANLNEGCELRRIERGEPDVEIRITRVNGLSSSDAVISRKGTQDATVRSGDLFELVRWVAPDRELLRVYIPRPVPQRELHLLIQVAAQLRKRGSPAFISDPTVDAPTHILSWAAAESQWSLRENRPDAQPFLMRSLSADALVHRLSTAKSPRLFVQFPPDEGIAGALKFENGAVAAVDSPELADYVLLGRLEPSSGRLEPGSDSVNYAWALADLTQSGLSKGKLSTRPLRTDWFPAGGTSDAGPKLKATALGLARVNGWLNLASPAADPDGPFELLLKHTRTGQIVSSTELRGGENYKLMLRARAGHPPAGPQRVYVFAVDSFGEAKLLFGDNLDNEFPRPGQAGVAGLVPLTTQDFDLTVDAPYGVDNYFLLTSEIPIDNPETIFNFAGVRTRGGELRAMNPLARLLENTVSGKRGGVSGIPLNWSIEHLTLVSVESGSK
jgi:hypothetical protein